MLNKVSFLFNYMEFRLFSIKHLYKYISVKWLSLPNEFSVNTNVFCEHHIIISV